MDNNGCEKPRHKPVKVVKTESGDFAVVQEVFSPFDVAFLAGLNIAPRWVKSC